jgi:2-polyprenyl-6-methoxyphenol hydroxylase-like FAD-dependent oxidoreductase
MRALIVGAGVGGLTLALRRSEAARRRRVKWVQDTSRSLGRVAPWSGRLSRCARNLGARWTPAFVADASVERLVQGGPVE